MNQVDKYLKTNIVKMKQNESQDNGFEKHINELFELMAAIYPRFGFIYKANDIGKAKKAWTKALVEGQVKTLQYGKKRMRQDTSDVPPSAGKFVSWCKPTPIELGLPTHQNAWYEANKNCHDVYRCEWSSPVVYEAGKRIGWFNLKEGRSSMDEFSTVYFDAVSEYALGAKFKLPERDSSLLEAKAGARIKTQEEVKKGLQALNDLKKEFGI